jgi:hypothetical protein
LDHHNREHADRRRGRRVRHDFRESLHGSPPDKSDPRSSTEIAARDRAPGRQDGPDRRVTHRIGVSRRQRSSVASVNNDRKIRFTSDARVLSSSDNLPPATRHVLELRRRWVNGTRGPRRGARGVHDRPGADARRASGPKAPSPLLPVPLHFASICLGRSPTASSRAATGCPTVSGPRGPCRSATPLADASPHHHPDPAVRGSHLGRPCRSVHAASRARGLRSAAGSASARSRAGRVATLRAADRTPRVSVLWRPNAPETRRRSVAPQCADAGPADATAYKNQRRWTRLPRFGRSPRALTRHRRRAPR